MHTSTHIKAHTIIVYTHTRHRKLNIWGHVGNFIRCNFSPQREGVFYDCPHKFTKQPHTQMPTQTNSPIQAYLVIWGPSWTPAQGGPTFKSISPTRSLWASTSKCVVLEMCYHLCYWKLWLWKLYAIIVRPNWSCNFLHVWGHVKAVILFFFTMCA